MGVFSPRKPVIFHSLLNAARDQLLLRGRDFVGVFPRGSGNVMHMQFSKGEKREEQLATFLSETQVTGHLLMLQTRAIPEPEVVGTDDPSPNLAASNRDAQPFRREGWVVSHNGTVANDRELRAEITDVAWQNESPIDSATLPYLFAREGIYPAIRDRVEGSFALAVYNYAPGVFHLAKNF